MKPTADITAEKQVEMLIKRNEELIEKLERVEGSFDLLCDLFGHVNSELMEMSNAPPACDIRPAELTIQDLKKIQSVRAEEKARRLGLQDKNWMPAMLEED